MTNTKLIMTGLVAGTVIGATLGLLFAPAKGSKIRTAIIDKVKRIGSTAEKK